MSTQTKERWSAHFTQHKLLSLKRNRLTMHKKSSIDCKLFAINDLAGHSPPCLKNGHSCSGCGHLPVCLKTVQPASFSSPRCPLFAVNAFDLSQGAHSPTFRPEFANSVASTTSPAVRPAPLSIYFSKPKKLYQGKNPRVACYFDMKNFFSTCFARDLSARNENAATADGAKQREIFSRQAISSAANAGVQRRRPNSPQGFCCPPGTLLLNGRPADDPALGDTNTIIFFGQQPAPSTCSK